ncbi:MAG: hypothetical protein GEV12_17785 [Micromonosporaceae bacterium]|nr:hypothetical protein [Micromonosporaceae bacterium]
MICFDTNVVIGAVGTRQETSLALLRGLACVTGYPLALPQTVFEELMGATSGPVYHDRDDRRDECARGLPIAAGAVA